MSRNKNWPGGNPFILASPKTEGHSAKVRLVVTMIEGFARRETQRHMGFYTRRTASPASRSGIATDPVVSAKAA